MARPESTPGEPSSPDASPVETRRRGSIYHAETLEDLEAAGAERQTFTLSRDAKLRLDRFLQSKLKGMSRNQVQRLIGLGGVLVNDKLAKASLSLREGDRVDVLIPPKPAERLDPEPIPLHVLYEDADLIAVNKQADLIVHPARAQLTGTMLNALIHHFQQSGQTPQGPVDSLSSVGADDARPGVVHRLDRFTTGVIVFAKRDASHWLLARQWERRTNLKAYLAVVHGNFDPPAGAIDRPLGRHPTIREAQAVRHDSSGKDSLTLYRTREQYAGYSLVEFELKTGRTHQIRVHASFAGHPLVGDILYGGEPVGPAELDDPPIPAASRPEVVFARTKEQGQKAQDAAKARPRADLIMAVPALHAALLRVEHPQDGRELLFTAPLHEPMATLVNELQARGVKRLPAKGSHIDLDKALPG
ncbi:MAG: RluA family pseudouridine synthase [Planctomycetota bacterium]